MTAEMVASPVTADGVLSMVRPASHSGQELELVRLRAIAADDAAGNAAG